MKRPWLRPSTLAVAVFDRRRPDVGGLETIGPGVRETFAGVGAAANGSLPLREAVVLWLRMFLFCVLEVTRIVLVLAGALSGEQCDASAIKERASRLLVLGLLTFFDSPY